MLNYKKNVTVITLSLLLSIQLFSQNLVQNPSFEDTKRCAGLIGNFDDNVKYWSTPTLGTTDIFSTCTKETVGIPNNYNGMQQKKSGNNYAGFYVHSDENYREYIQVELSEKLEKGKEYKVSFYVSLAEKSDFAIKNIDFMVTEKKLNTTISRELSTKQLKKNNINNYSLHTIENSKFYDNKSSWMLISKDFVSNGNENYLTIGNFLKNSKTDKKLVSNKNRYNMSYYYIDLIHLERVDLDTTVTVKLEKEKKIKPEPKEIRLNKEYTFENVVFDFNSYALSKKGEIEINYVFNFLRKNSNTIILISGHTDNIGNDEFNQKLSQRRAKSVADYFLTLGLEKNRISFVGFGNKKPITTNETEFGRNKNRRVEFKISKE